MHKIQIKPLSVNQAWQGKRFKTPLYKQWSVKTLLMMPKKINVPEGKLKVKINFGFSNSGSDIDNPVKPFLDMFKFKYDINDNRIYKLEVEKFIVKKGFDYIEYIIEKYQ